MLEYTLDALPDDVDEVIMVIGYLGEQIKSYLGGNFRGRKIKYVIQEKLEGTAEALYEAKTLIRGRFLVLMADDIYAKADIEKCLKNEQAMLVMKTNIEGPGGKVVLGEKGELEDVIEGNAHPAGTLIGTNVFVLNEKFFTYQPVRKASDSEEYGLPQTVVLMSKDYPVAVVEATKWIKITTPEDLKLAERLLKV